MLYENIADFFSFLSDLLPCKLFSVDSAKPWPAPTSDLYTQVTLSVLKKRVLFIFIRILPPSLIALLSCSYLPWPKCIDMICTFTVSEWDSEFLVFLNTKQILQREYGKAGFLQLCLLRRTQRVELGAPSDSICLTMTNFSPPEPYAPICKVKFLD